MLFSRIPAILVITQFTASAAMAQSVCNGNSLSKAQMDALLTGNTVCGRPGAHYPGGVGSSDRWQEEHVSGGQLWDYKLGPGHAVDPRKQVGTWITSASAVRGGAETISHIYGPTVAFTWVMYGPASNANPGSTTYQFCLGSAQHVVAHIRIGSVSCPSYP